MVINLFFSKIRAKLMPNLHVESAQKDWNAWIPKCDGLVASGCPTLSSKVAHYTEPTLQK